MNIMHEYSYYLNTSDLPDFPTLDPPVMHSLTSDKHWVAGSVLISYLDLNVI